MGQVLLEKASLPPQRFETNPHGSNETVEFYEIDLRIDLCLQALVNGFIQPMQLPGLHHVDIAAHDVFTKQFHQFDSHRRQQSASFILGQGKFHFM